MSYKIVVSRAQLQAFVTGLSKLNPESIVEDKDDGDFKVQDLVNLCQSTLDYKEDNTTHGFIL